MIDDWDPAPKQKLSDEEDNIERIVRHERHYFEDLKTHKLAFLVKWDGYDETHLTWEPFDNTSLLTNEVFQNYVKEHKLDYLLTGNADKEGKRMADSTDESDDWGSDSDSDKEEPAPRPETPELRLGLGDISDILKANYGEWKCPYCKEMNKVDALICMNCGNDKTTAEEVQFMREDHKRIEKLSHPQKMKEASARLRKLARKLVDVDRDGSCFYHAIAHQINNRFPQLRDILTCKMLSLYQTTQTIPTLLLYILLRMLSISVLVSGYFLVLTREDERLKLVNWTMGGLLIVMSGIEVVFVVMTRSDKNATKPYVPY